MVSEKDSGTPASPEYRVEQYWGDGNASGAMTYTKSTISDDADRPQDAIQRPLHSITYQ